MEDTPTIKTPEQQKYLDELGAMLADLDPKMPFGVLEQQEVENGVNKIKGGLRDAASLMKIPGEKPHTMLKVQEEERFQVPQVKREKLSAEELTPDPVYDMESQVIGLLKENASTEEGVLSKILEKENVLNERSGRISTLKIRVKRALDSLKEKKLLIDQGGILRPALGFGGSDLSSQPKETVDIANHSFRNYATKGLNKLADSAEWVTKKVAEKTPYGRLVGRLEVLAADAPDAIRKKINTFLFDIKGEKMEEVLGKLSELQVALPGEYENLVHLAEEGLNESKGEEIISGELPYHEGFVPEPPPVVDQQPAFSSYSNRTQNNEATSMMDGIRIGAENWSAQHLEDAQGNKLPLTAENYIRSIGGVVNAENIAQVENSLDSLVNQGLGTKTNNGYEIIKKSRITKKESVKEKVSEIPSLLLSTLDDLADHSDRPAGIKALAYSLKQPETTKEQANMLIETSTAFDVNTKKKLIAVLFGVSAENTPEPLPVLPVPVQDPASRVKSLNERVSEAVVAAKGMDISKAVVNQFSTARYSEPIGPITEKEADEIWERLDLEQRDAREAFAKEEALRKTEIYKNKKPYQKLMAELGVPEKQRPDTIVSEKYSDAQKRYMQARKAFKDFIANRRVEEVEVVSKRDEYSILENTKIRRIDRGVMDYIKEDADSLIEMIKKEIPEKERGIITMGLEKWAKIPVVARVALSATFFTVVSGGAVSVASGLGAISLRAARGLGGVAGAKLTGIALDSRNEKKSKEAEQKALEDYATIDGVDDEEKDAKFKQYLEGKDIKEKRDRVKKIAIMAAAGGVSAAATGVLMDSGYNALSGTGSKINPDINTAPKPKPSLMEKMFKKPSPVESATAPKVVVPEKIVEASVDTKYATPVGVNLSSRGFIDTVDQLKQATNGQKLTPALEKLFAQSPQKIAMDLGLFKPGQAAESASGFQNEKLSIDIDGNLSLEHTGGNEILMNADGTFKPFAGEMFDADKQSTSPVPTDVAPTQKMVEVTSSTPKPVVEVVPKASNIEIKSAGSKFDTAADTATPAVALAEVKPRVPVDFDQTVVKSPEYTGPQDMVFGKLPLKSEYQFDPKFKAERTAYNIRLEKELMSIPAGTFDLRFPIEYNGGRINVFQKGPNITIFLNGEELGTGAIIDGQPGLQYKRSLGTGMFGSTTDFEKAFEEAQKAIMKNKMFFKKP